MRRIRELLRLKHENGLSTRQLAAALGISKGAVSDYVQRLQVAGLGWPLPEGLEDTALERRLFPGQAPSKAPRAEPDWAGVDRELRRQGVTRALLWQEYRGRTSGWLRLHLVLRALRRLEGAALADDAPEARGRREGLRRLRRRHDRCDRSDDRRGPADEAVRGGDGRVELHLRRGAAEREAWRTGSAAMSASSPSSAACRRSWSATTSSPR